MITAKQRAELRERGYTEAQIKELTPREAHAILTDPPPTNGAGTITYTERAELWRLGLSDQDIGELTPGELSELLAV